MCIRDRFKRFIKIASLIAVSIGTVFFICIFLFVPYDSIHLYIAGFLGIFVTLGITVVLMGLIFYSNRMGYDGEFQQDED